MTEIRPFAALRPIPELVSQIAELPYDVMNTAEAREILKKNPLSFIRVSRAEADLPENLPDTDERVYARAKENLEDYIRKGQLKQDPAPCYYIYRQQMGASIQIGLVAVTSLKEYKDGLIRRHETTRPLKKTDRSRHIMATKAQTGPVFLAYRSKGLLTALLMEYMGNHGPVYDFTGDDGIRHTLYVINEVLKIQEITRLFRQVSELYIADGHNRCASALEVAEELAKRPDQTGKEQYNYVLSVIFPENMLHIMAYNRVVRDLHGLTGQEFLNKVAEKFNVEPVERPVTPIKKHMFGMYLGGRWYRLTALPDAFDDTDPVASIDVSILQDNVLVPILGIGDPKTDPRLGFIGGNKGVKALAETVDNGDYTLAFSLYPTSMEQLMKVADAGLVMPAQSTWFEPKLRDALTVHLIGDEQDGKSL